jgi:structural maintenance of chromosome 4
MLRAGGQTTRRPDHQGVEEVREGGGHLVGKEEAPHDQAEEVQEVYRRGESAHSQTGADRGLTYQDGHTRSEALASIENYSAELDVNRVKVGDLEKKLETEYAELEEIRDGLKGQSLSATPVWTVAYLRADKTDEFTTKIEDKQRELEPWTAKISEKQSAIDVATSERDLLAQKATGAQQALEEARANLDKLRDGDGAKQEEYEALKKEAVKVKKQLAAAEENIQVRSRLTGSLDRD